MGRSKRPHEHSAGECLMAGRYITRKKKAPSAGQGVEGENQNRGGN